MNLCCWNSCRRTKFTCKVNGQIESSSRKRGSQINVFYPKDSPDTFPSSTLDNWNDCIKHAPSTCKSLVHSNDYCFVCSSMKMRKMNKRINLHSLFFLQTFKLDFNLHFFISFLTLTDLPLLSVISLDNLECSLFFQTCFKISIHQKRPFKSEDQIPGVFKITDFFLLL